MTEVIISGTAGRIVGKYHQASAINVPIVLLLHPHPLHGGTMNNKVVYSMYKTCVQMGFTALRINFRGVGKSEGEFDNGVGELHDAATALDWLQFNNPSSSSIWIGGFSFGSWIAMHLVMRRPEVNEFIAVAPPVDKYDFSFLSPCPISGLVLQGNQDSIVNEKNVVDFVEWISQQQCAKVKYSSIYGADHFFRNKLDEFEDSITEYIKSNLSKYSNIGNEIKKSRNQDEWDELINLK